MRFDGVPLCPPLDRARVVSPDDAFVAPLAVDEARALTLFVVVSGRTGKIVHAHHPSRFLSVANKVRKLLSSF